MLALGTMGPVTAARIAASAAIAVLLCGQARAEDSLEERKLPMKFALQTDKPDCTEDCRTWISAVGIITEKTPSDFEAFADGKELDGRVVVLDSSGGSVNDAILLGRKFRDMKLMTRVGGTLSNAAGSKSVYPEAYCESMCVFLFLSGTERYSPPGAHMRVHQIWMGDRADNPKEASYGADDVSIIERDIGRLAKYAYEMGGGGGILAVALETPPWEPLHEMSADEMAKASLTTPGAQAAMSALPEAPAVVAIVDQPPKAIQDRLPSDEHPVASMADRPADPAASPSKALASAVN